MNDHVALKRAVFMLAQSARTGRLLDLHSLSWWLLIVNVMLLYFKQDDQDFIDLLLLCQLRLQQLHLLPQLFVIIAGEIPSSHEILEILLVDDVIWCR